MAKKKYPQWATTVTPLSKFLAMTLFILFPFIGFYLGTRYQQIIDGTSVPFTTNVQNYITANQSPNKLLILRDELKAANLPAFAQTITDKKIIQQLYTDIDALPPPYKGVTSCTFDSGVRYTLDFYSGETRILHTFVNPMGCRYVTLSNGKERAATGAMGDSFINDLKTTLHLSNQNFYGHYVSQ